MNTQTKWRAKDVNPDAYSRQIWTDESHGSVLIATTGGADRDANAEQIVREHNAHASLTALVTVLSASLRDLVALHDDSVFLNGSGDEGTVTNVLRGAHNALKRVGK